MVSVKAKEVQQEDILRIESEMNNLWGDLNTFNISQPLRKEIEEKLAGFEEEFKAALGGQASVKELEKKLHEVDMVLAMGVIQQAENEIPKADHHSSNFRALENIRQELEEGKIKPVRARHDVKEIVRHHG